MKNSNLLTLSQSVTPEEMEQLDRIESLNDLRRKLSADLITAEEQLTGLIEARRSEMEELGIDPALIEKVIDQIREAYEQAKAVTKSAQILAMREKRSAA